MMFFCVVGHSEDLDSQGALDEIIGQCRQKLGDRVPKAGLLFAAIDQDHPLVLSGLRDEWPGMELIGCTTDGEFSSELGFCEDSITLVLFGSDTIEFAAGVGKDVSHDITAACGRAIDQARVRAGAAPAICITFPASMTTSSNAIVEALSTKLGDGIPVVGATAGDGYRLVSTYQFCGREVYQDAVPVLLFFGPLIYSVAVESGWEPVGEPGLVTRSEGRVVHEIDGKPAVEFYRRFQGETAVPTPECSLAILDAEGQVECLRTSTGVWDEKTGAVTYLGDIREGSMVQITIAGRVAILNGCTASIEKAFSQYPHGKSPEAALFFSCAGRKMLLGTRTKEEYDIIKLVLGVKVPVCGFYGYGEIGPRDTDDRVSRFHNQTFVSLIMGT